MIEQKQIAQFTKTDPLQFRSLPQFTSQYDHITKKHVKRVANTCYEFSAHLNLPKTICNLWWLGAFLHDVGKIQIPDEILLKKGKLNDEEWNIIQQHPENGYEILRKAGWGYAVATPSLFHHEKWDGSGYPFGLKGDRIPLVARVLAVIDVWDALTSTRSYRPALSCQEAYTFIQSNAGTLFDPGVVVKFLQFLGTQKHHKYVH